MSNLIDPVKVCPNCGGVNEVFEPFCPVCSQDLSVVDPIERASLNSNLVPITNVTVKLLNIDLVTGKPDGKEIELPVGDGELVLGRDAGSFVPNINVKGWSIPYISPDKGDPLYGQKQRGISRSHAVIVRSGDHVGIYRHPDATAQLPVKVGDYVVTSTDAATAVELTDGSIIKLGDIFIPGAKPKAPGVLIKVLIQ